MTDERLLGPYRIEQRLATGGMAEVFVARREGAHGFSKRVAIKRILPQFSRDPDFVGMFIDEARLAAKLEHPNIVQVFDFGTLGEALILVMELVDGTNASRMLRAVGNQVQIPWDIVLHIGYQTAKALQYAHGVSDERGQPLSFVHRDVSPANILITKSGHVKLTDFGIATVRSRAPTTEEGQVRGKLGYMSPEQVLGKELTGKSDVFTLGIVLAEMLVGESLFSGASELNTLLRIRDADIGVFLQTKRPIPGDIRALIAWAMARDPGERPTAGQFAKQCADIMRRRAMASAPDRLAKYIRQLGLLQEEGELSSSPISVEFSTDLVASVDSKIPPEHTTPAASYRVKRADGTILGPFIYSKLVESIVTGNVDDRCLVAKNDGEFMYPGDFFELASLISSHLYDWDNQAEVGPLFRGSIRANSMLPVFAEIIQRAYTGALHLESPEKRKRIYFVDGKLRHVVSTSREELLGEHLIASGRCMRMEIEMAVALLPKFGGRLGDALVGMGALRAIELVEAIAEQLRLRVIEAFRWRAGSWSYIDQARTNVEVFPTNFDSYEWLREGAKELSFETLKPYVDALLVSGAVPAESPPPLALFRLDPGWMRIVETLRTTGKFAAAAEVSITKGLNLADTYRAAYLALASGLVRPADRQTNWTMFSEIKELAS